MNAPKMSHTVPLENPASAHLSASTGSWNVGVPSSAGENTSPPTAITETPTSPTASAGIGSRRGRG